MDLTWLFFILCPYMLIYFYFCDFTNWAHWKITIFWLIGMVVIILLWFLINYLNPNPLRFPEPFISWFRR